MMHAIDMEPILAGLGGVGVWASMSRDEPSARQDDVYLLNATED